MTQVEDPCTRQTEVQRKARTMKNEFWREKVAEAKLYALNNDLYNFH